MMPKIKVKAPRKIMALTMYGISGARAQRIMRRQITPSTTVTRMLRASLRYFIHPPPSFGVNVPYLVDSHGVRIAGRPVTAVAPDQNAAVHEYRRDDVPDHGRFTYRIIVIFAASSAVSANP
jgi:hypothetical protein